MPEQHFVVIVASPRPRTGKTLLARLLVEHFARGGASPAIFDTDASERRLAAYFPERAAIVDLDRVPDQMRLFDSLSAPAATTQVIDLTHRSFSKFLRLVRDIDYVAEAKARRIEPVFVYLPDREPESYERAQGVREQFRECAFVFAENEALGDAGRELRRTGAFEAMRAYQPRIALPKLDPFLMGAVDDPTFSIAEFMQWARSRDAARLPPARPAIAYVSHEARSGILAWLKTGFAEIERAMHLVAAQAEGARRDPLRL